ncbi:MAG: response regulator [Elusimicrobia bacterium]|nr:response regulator [Elusimicrobiota bacterium]
MKIRSLPSVATVVLAVDDDASVRAEVAAAMPRSYRLIALPDGSEFMETVEAYEPDLVILNPQAPGEDGVSLARRLRSRAEFRHIPVLFLTSMNEEAAWRRLLEGQGDAVLAKPFAPGELRNAIVRLVEGRIEQG